MTSRRRKKGAGGRFHRLSAAALSDSRSLSAVAIILGHYSSVFNEFQRRYRLPSISSAHDYFRPFSRLFSFILNGSRLSRFSGGASDYRRRLFFTVHGLSDYFQRLLVAAFNIQRRKTLVAGSDCRRQLSPTAALGHFDYSQLSKKDWLPSFIFNFRRR